MKWIHEHDLILLVYGLPAAAAVLQAFGVFHV